MNTKISYSKIEGYCNELHALASQIKETLENIEQIGKKVQSSGSWSGDASSFYVNKINNVSKNFTEIFEEIENSILYMASCAEGYQAIDKMVMGEICSNLNITEPNLNTSRIFNGG